MKKYDVVIIGAGPAGLFCAYELVEANKKLKIALVDKGNRVETRMCPMKVNGGKCLNCKTCQILSGFGGAGTFSDGKLNFIPKLGKSDLFKYMSMSEANALIDDTEKIFTKFKMDSDVYPSNMDEALKIKKDVAKTGARLLLIKQKHLGSDKLPEYIKGFTDYLEKKGVDIYEHSDVKDMVADIVRNCETLRQRYLETKDKRYWKELIRWLPESWLQKRTVTMTYENLLAMCSKGQRRFHKLNEWSGQDNPNVPNFISWARTLPYAQELIFIDETLDSN